MNTRLWNGYVSVFKSIGLWPTQHKGMTRLLLKFLFWSHFLGTALILIIFEITFLLMSIKDNFVESVKTFGATIYHIICLLTMVLWIFKCSTAENLLKLLNRSSFQNFYIGDNNQGFVASAFARARFWSLSSLYSFLVAAFSSIGLSYVGIWSLSDDVSKNGTAQHHMVKPYNSYTFLDLNKVTITVALDKQPVQKLISGKPFSYRRILSVLRNKLFNVWIFE